MNKTSPDKNFCAGSRLHNKHRRQQRANVLTTLDSHTTIWKLKQTYCGAALVLNFACDALCRMSAACFSESSSNEMGSAASAALPAGSCAVLSVSCQEERESNSEAGWRWGWMNERGGGTYGEKACCLITLCPWEIMDGVWKSKEEGDSALSTLDFCDTAVGREWSSSSSSSRIICIRQIVSSYRILFVDKLELQHEFSFYHSNNGECFPLLLVTDS